VKRRGEIRILRDGQLANCPSILRVSTGPGNVPNGDVVDASSVADDLGH
jgi:hypothetical protein